MITLYRVAECSACDEVQETLRELVVAHEVVDVDEAADKSQPAAITGQELPVIQDGDQWVSGEPALANYLQQLARDAELWRKFQSDVCYVDDQGRSC